MSLNDQEIQAIARALELNQVETIGADEYWSGLGAEGDRG